MNFVVWTPPYNHKSAGIRVMHRLVDLLVACGHNAAGTCEPGYPVSRDTIAIYPDYFGCINPLGARRIIRYMLGYPPPNYGMIPGNEFVLVYVPKYMASVQACCGYKIPADNLMPLPSVEPDLFKPLDKTVPAAYYVGKGASRFNKRYVPAGALEITRTWPEDRKELASILGHTKDFYTWDHYTVMSEEAHLSGCRVWLVDEVGAYHPLPYNEGMLLSAADKDMVAAAMLKAADFFNTRL